MTDERDEQGAAGQADEQPAGKLLEDPPLMDRLLWRDPIRSETMLSADRGLIARAMGTLFVIGAAVALLALVFGDDANRADEPFAVILVAALTAGAVCFVGYRRLPPIAFQLLVAAGTLLISVAVAASVEGAEGLYAMIYVWIVLVAGLFFTRRAAALQIAFILVAYALVLALRNSEFALIYLLVATPVLLTAGTIVAWLRVRLEQLAANLASQAHTDKLTGLANRRGFDERFALELARAARSGKPLSLIMCDLDHFKAVNDALGHSEGDIALQRAARSIERAVRAMDSVARPGGEEFAVLLPGAGTREAFEVAERLRTGVLAEFAGYEVALTGSCGVATASAVNGGAPDSDQLLRRADEALYGAKRAGRNCSVVYDESLGADASSTK